jgi:class 3 adenylate cyclase
VTIQEWLARFGLSRLEATFQENGIDLDVLASLTDGDPKELGLTLGNRKRVLAALAAPDQSTATAPAPQPSSLPQAEAERRQLTVLFCDLAGSTALSARLDPEDMREVIRAYQDACTAVVARHDGFVAKFMGDGLLAYFGYPRAHEDEAERTVRAGREIVAAVGGLETPAREALQVRIGIATGLVVVGDLIGAGAAQEQSVVGETPNLAARLQALAKPNAILIAESTRRQLGSLFELGDLGPQTLKGFDAPQPAWQVMGESGVASRFEALRTGSTPLVGRDEEIDLLLRRWANAKSGEGNVVLIVCQLAIVTRPADQHGDEVDVLQARRLDMLADGAVADQAELQSHESRCSTQRAQAISLSSPRRGPTSCTDKGRPNGPVLKGSATQGTPNSVQKRLNNGSPV